MRAFFLASVALLALPVLGSACATGDLIEDDGDEIVGARGDAGNDSGVTIRPDSGPASPPKGSSSSSGETADAGQDGGSTSSGGSSSGGSSSGGTTTGEPDVCTGATCGGATDLGRINGDDGSPTVTATGTQSKWVTVEIYDSALGGVDISWGLNFVPAAGVDYEIRVADAQNATCSTATKIIPPAKYTSYENNWTDDTPLVNDGHRVYLQVKQISGACPSAAPWTLKITGNTY